MLLSVYRVLDFSSYMYSPLELREKGNRSSWSKESSNAEEMLKNKLPLKIKVHYKFHMWRELLIKFLGHAYIK
jgi:hypothetical protein